MNKFGFLLPILMVVLFSFLGTRLMASGTINPFSMILMGAVLLVIMLVLRPKKGVSKSVAELEAFILGDYGKDAFANDEKLREKFLSAMKDYSGNMPKAALNKLQKLAPLCQEDPDIYAVSMVTAHLCISQNKPKDAIRAYVRALSIHPSSALAQSLGSAYQRIGELDKARDTYQYALDLDSSNLEALSAIATTYVADRNYRMGLDIAMEVLEHNEDHASALATAAICYGVMDDPVMCKYYTDRAVRNGYKQDKITQTISALKKR